MCNIPIHNEMRTRSSSRKSLVPRLLLSFVLCWGQMAFAGQKCEDSVKAGLRYCTEYAKRVEESSNAKALGCLETSLFNSFTCKGNVERETGLAAESVANGVIERHKECVDACTADQDDQEKCKKVEECGANLKANALAALTASFENAKSTKAMAGSQGSNPTGSGDNSWVKWVALAGLGGALVAGGISAFGNKGGSQPQPQPQNNNNSTQTGLQPLPSPSPVFNPADSNSTPDGACGAANTAKYSTCNNYYAQNCKTNSTDANCQTFISRYCGTGIANPGSTNQGLVVDKTGEGMGQTYCQNIVAVQFCAADPTGRKLCPSCQNLSSQQNSPACTGVTVVDGQTQTAGSPNSSLCQPMFNLNDATQVAAAQKNCPVADPVFSNPAYTQVGVGTQTPANGLPIPVVSTSSAKFRDVASVSAGFTDVASAQSPSLTSISSGAIQNWCKSTGVVCGKTSN